MDERTSTSDQPRRRPLRQRVVAAGCFLSRGQAAATAPPSRKHLALDAFTLDATIFLSAPSNPSSCRLQMGDPTRLFRPCIRRIACAQRHKTCPECLLRRPLHLFLHLRNADAAGSTSCRSSQAPRPYFLEPPQERDATMNRAIQNVRTGADVGDSYLPYFIYAFEELGKFGIGRGKGTIELLEVRRREASIAQKKSTAGQHDINPVAHPLTWRHLIARSHPHNRPAPQFTSQLHRTPRQHVESRLSFAVLLQSLVRRIAICPFSLRHPVGSARLDGVFGKRRMSPATRMGFVGTTGNAIPTAAARIQMGGLWAILSTRVISRPFGPIWPWVNRCTSAKSEVSDWAYEFVAWPNMQ